MAKTMPFAHCNLDNAHCKKETTHTRPLRGNRPVATRVFGVYDLRGPPPPRLSAGQNKTQSRFFYCSLLPPLVIVSYALLEIFFSWIVLFCFHLNLCINSWRNRRIHVHYSLIYERASVFFRSTMFLFLTVYGIKNLIYLTKSDLALNLHCKNQILFWSNHPVVFKLSKW